MTPAQLIEAKLNGATLDELLDSVDAPALDPDKKEFFEEMLSEIKKVTPEFEKAITEGDLARISKVAASFEEIFLMVKDAAKG